MCREIQLTDGSSNEECEPDVRCRWIGQEDRRVRNAGAHEAIAKIHPRYDVVIVTTRVNPDLRDSEVQVTRVLEWLERNGFMQGEHFDSITHVKPPALVYVDDRALHFTAWDQALEELAGRYPLDHPNPPMQ